MKRHVIHLELYVHLTDAFQFQWNGSECSMLSFELQMIFSIFFYRHGEGNGVKKTALPYWFYLNLSGRVNANCKHGD